MTAKEYISSPSRASSLPYWKSIGLCIPNNMKVIREDLFDTNFLTEYDDEPYFKLVLSENRSKRPSSDSKYILSTASLDELSTHITECYGLKNADSLNFEDYSNHPVFDASLWIKIVEKLSGRIVASGIAELDPEIREGILEWIQVSPDYRRKGFGKTIVLELLWRMKDKTDFVTVSGSMENPHNPLALYESCGFSDRCIWHVLRRK